MGIQYSRVALLITE